MIDLHVHERDKHDPEPDEAHTQSNAHPGSMTRSAHAERVSARFSQARCWAQGRKITCMRAAPRSRRAGTTFKAAICTDGCSSGIKRLRTQSTGTGRSSVACSCPAFAQWKGLQGNAAMRAPAAATAGRLRHRAQSAWDTSQRLSIGRRWNTLFLPVNTTIA